MASLGVAHFSWIRSLGVTPLQYCMWEFRRPHPTLANRKCKCISAGALTGAVHASFQAHDLEAFRQKWLSMVRSTQACLCRAWSRDDGEAQISKACFGIPRNHSGVVLRNFFSGCSGLVQASCVCSCRVAAASGILDLLFFVP